MSHDHPIYDDEKRFIIDPVTRIVKLDSVNRPVLIQYDHNSEHITFECARFIEGHDLTLCDKVEVHYNNIGPNNRTNKGVYPVVDLKLHDSDNSKVIFTWIVSQNATFYKGMLAFVVSFYCTNDGDIYYRWNTCVNSELAISEGIDNSEAVASNYADVLEMWKMDLFGIEDTAEARMSAFAQRQQDAMEVKIREVMKSLPNEYMDYADFEKSKVNVTDINRFFDSDWILKNRQNLYPHGDASFTYDGEALYRGEAAGDYFYLEEGRYDLVITDTNAVGIYVMFGETDIRLLEIKDHHIGVHGLSVTSEYANRPLVLRYYASAGTANEAGEYYIKRPYIFKSSNEGVLANDFFIKTPAKLLESDLVRQQKGDNLYTGGNIEFYYDGLQTYKGKNGFTFTLDEGDYTLTVLDSHAIFYVLYAGTTPTSYTPRILETSDMPVGYKFTITEEYANKPLTFFISASLATTMPAGDYYAKSIYIFKDDGIPFLPDHIVGNIGTRISGPAFKSQNGCLSVTTDRLTQDESLTIDAVCNVKKNKSLVFTGKLPTLIPRASQYFSELRIGHGKSSYGGSYIVVNNNTVDVMQCTNVATMSNSKSHGLTFSDFITIVINVGVNFANITIFTGTGSFTLDNVEWSGCNGSVFAEVTGMELGDCKLTWTSSDIKERVWVFGDSYLGFNDNRWAGQMHNLGYKNWLACGFPGGGSANELASFKTLLTLGTPDIVVWCLGMNNGDNGAVNSSWLKSAEEVAKLCRYNNITLVLATIPSCPIVDNTYKNEWVRNSGYRYVDFNKAVGADILGTSWYNGMLSGDSIHPTELGAKTLASRVCVDVPEIMNTNYRKQLDTYYP